MCKEVPFAGLVDTSPFRAILGGKTPNLGGPETGNRIIRKTANNSKTVRDRENVTAYRLLIENRVRAFRTRGYFVYHGNGIRRNAIHRSPGNALKAYNWELVRDTARPNSKPCLMNPLLFWSPWRRGWAKRYIA